MYSVIIEQFDLTKACIKEFTPNIVLTDILSLHNKMDDAVENEQKTQTHAHAPLKYVLQSCLCHMLCKVYMKWRKCVLINLIKQP